MAIALCHRSKAKAGRRACLEGGKAIAGRNPARGTVPGCATPGDRLDAFNAQGGCFGCQRFGFQDVGGDFRFAGQIHVEIACRQLVRIRQAAIFVFGHSARHRHAAFRERLQPFRRQIRAGYVRLSLAIQAAEGDRAPLFTFNALQRAVADGNAYAFALANPGVGSVCTFLSAMVQ